MTRPAPLFVTALLLAGLAPIAPTAHAQPAAQAADTVQAERPGFTSPRAAFDAGMLAFNERRWDGFLQSVEPGQQAALVGEMVSAMEVMRQQPEADPRVAQLVKRFFPRGVPADATSLDTATRRAATAPQVAELESPAAFFAAATNLAMDLQHGSGASEVRVEDLGTLRPVKTADGASNRAVRAEVTLRLPGSDTPRRDVWTFVVIDKRWYLAPLGVQ